MPQGVRGSMASRLKRVTVASPSTKTSRFALFLVGLDKLEVPLLEAPLDYAGLVPI